MRTSHTIFYMERH